MSSFKKMDTEASRQFWESLESNRRVVATWPEETVPNPSEHDAHPE